MPHSSVMRRAPQGRLMISASVSTSRVSLMSKCIRSRFGSSSSAVAAPKRMESPKSLAARPGMMVSRSMMQSPFPVFSSNRMLFSFVSLCVTRSGRSPSSCCFTSTPQSSSLARTKSISGRQVAARFFRSRFRANVKAPKRFTVLWKSGMVSFSLDAG